MSDEFDSLLDKGVRKRVQRMEGGFKGGVIKIEITGWRNRSKNGTNDSLNDWKGVRIVYIIYNICVFGEGKGLGYARVRLCARMS